MWKLQLSGTLADAHTRTHIQSHSSPSLYKSDRSSRNLYSWLEMEMEQPRGGVLLCYHQLLRCTGGERVTFNSVKMGASNQLAADALVHIETVQMVFKVRRGKLRGMVPRAEGVISCSHHLAAVKGDKQENQYSHSGQFTTRASLSRPVCQNQSLKWSGMWTADKVGVRAHWSHSYSAIEVLFSTVDSSRKTATNSSKLIPSLSTLCRINIIVIAWH